MSFLVPFHFKMCLYRLHSVLLLLVSTLFGLFVIAIMIDQLHAIFYDEITIDATQFKDIYQQNFKFKLMADIFGQTHPFYWLFPCIDTKPYDPPLMNHIV